jgi:predicted enzyme related to lactoylglutathione lyase
MNRVAHFEIHASDIKRAVEFYTKVFGWQMQEWKGLADPYWMVMTADKESKEVGINGGMIIRKGPAPVEGQAVNAYVCTMVVDNIDAIGQAILAAGGTLALPKFAIKGMAWQAYYKDTEGNIFGIHQADPAAA